MNIRKSLHLEHNLSIVLLQSNELCDACIHRKQRFDESCEFFQVANPLIRCKPKLPFVMI
jgi:hypothetical protein